MTNTSDLNAANEPAFHEKSDKNSGRHLITFVIVTAFLNIMSMTISSPVTPFMVQKYVVDPHNLALVTGALFSCYSVCQFFAAPMLGALSDRYGRRWLLLICLLGSAIGYVMYGLGGALWIFFLSRIIDGLTGGNISILFALMADITKPEERGKLFGLLGAVSGIGLIVGPALGGFVARLGYQVPFYMAAALMLVNMLWCYFFVPETLSKERRSTQTALADLSPFKRLGDLFLLPQLRWLLLAGVFYSVPFMVFRSTITLLTKDNLGWHPENIGLILLVVGSMDILVQGVLIGRLLPIFGEVRLVVGGFVCQIIGYLLISVVAFEASPIILFTGVTIYALGGGLIEPSLGALSSRAAGSEHQGAFLGGSQSLQSLVYILAPLWAGFLYVQFGHATPYWSNVVVVGLAIVFVLMAMSSLKARSSQIEAG
ncbi:MAG TPA: MFS transporter [Ktedonosporobacter sp.]|nr:MFS transporter [Ktedonosporobacter sp.]